MTQFVISVILLTSLALDVRADPIDPHVTPETRTLYNVLQSLASHKDRVIVGTHQPTLFGLYGGHKPYWTYDYNGKPHEAWMFNPDMAHANHSDELCDPCAVVNDFPAMVGFDFSMIGNDIEDAWVYLLKKAHERGAIITFCDHTKNLITGHNSWIGGDNNAVHSIKRLLPGGDHYHSFLSKMDKVATFIKYKLVDKHGKPIPIIYRPWHEANAGWFWWGQHNAAQNTEDDFKRLFQNTVKHLKDTKGLHNIIYATSPDCGGRDPELIYPGDDYVDILGMDCYLTPQRDAAFLKTALNKVVQRAKAKGKIPTLTETGVMLQDLTARPHFFTQEILNTISSLDGGLAYVFTWNNQFLSQSNVNIFNPYPGHPVAPDFKNFHDDKRTYFLSDLKANYPQLYQ